MVLAAGGDSPDLRLEELIKLRLNQSMLVVLSACDTNSENIVPGEGSTGIAQKFIAIGAPLVVAGNWKIDSVSTAEIMQAFHTNRRTQKMTSAEALRQAQLSAMLDRDGNPRPPYHWAAFAAIGGYTDY
jgi:CHAT domain-containing protein